MLGDEEAGRLPDRLADPADGEQQDRRGDRDENVVEAGDEPELLFVRNGRRALRFNIFAKRRCVRGADDAGGDGVVELLLAVHSCPPVGGGTLQLVCYSVNTPTHSGIRGYGGSRMS